MGPEPLDSAPLSALPLTTSIPLAADGATRTWQHAEGLTCRQGGAQAR